MNKINYDALMQDKIENAYQGKNKKLLIHSCCAPCSTACLERLKGVFDITVLYYNPNIDTELEFNKRLLEQRRFCDEFGIKVIDLGYRKDEFLGEVIGLENEKEGGKRCEKCFYLRLKKTACYARVSLDTWFDLWHSYPLTRRYTPELRVSTLLMELDTPFPHHRTISFCQLSRLLAKSILLRSQVKADLLCKQHCSACNTPFALAQTYRSS